jgi:hypothetical protein
VGVMHCYKCGYGSLVRSNFKATTDHQYYCRAEDKCNQRVSHTRERKNDQSANEQAFRRYDDGQGCS